MTYSLRHASFRRLKAQTNLTGCFTHSLFDKSTGSTVLAMVDIERGTDRVEIIIRMGSTCNRLTLPLDAKLNADCVAGHLEAIANGRFDTADADLDHHPFNAAA